MQNVKDMREVEPGIFIPTVTSYLTDEFKWRKDNVNYSCIINKNSKEILVAFLRGVDGVAYSNKNFNCETFCVGCMHDTPDFYLGGLFPL